MCPWEGKEQDEETKNLKRSEEVFAERLDHFQQRIKEKEALKPLTDMIPRPKEPDTRIIDWIYVYGLYDGIVINPWIESKKRYYMWYSGWECASGCIWNLTAIDKLELVNE